ncbi:hypothetical protein [Fluviicola sp.]|uniref:hypothetical protein n=1 Tax=Fluviicola sp. TaxID=1917219 RepID=UPI0031DD7E17
MKRKEREELLLEYMNQLVCGLLRETKTTKINHEIYTTTNSHNKSKELQEGYDLSCFLFYTGCINHTIATHTNPFSKE